jgi:uncharacterized protein with von Willebrand factor type A (vWA) domain
MPSADYEPRELIGIHSDREYRETLGKFRELLKETDADIRAKIDAWHRDMRSSRGEGAFDEERRLLEAEEHDLSLGKASLGAVLEDLDLMSDYYHDPYLGILWGRAVSHPHDDKVLMDVRRETLSRWRERYGDSSARYEGKFDDDSVRMAMNTEARDFRTTAAIELGGKFGIGRYGEAYATDAWGTGDGELHDRDDMSEILAWERKIMEDPVLLALCRELGRSVSEIREQDEVESSPSDEGAEDLLAREEITGIELGQSIADMLPTELLRLGDDALSTLFDLDFAERKMLVFARTGRTDTGNSEDDGEGRPGPVIVCVDTSGSMSGGKEEAAKAAVLVIASEALADGRPCYLIDFSVGIASEDLAHIGAKGLADFLRKGFGGGTDPSQAFAEALRVLQNETYRRADVIMISDFDMSPDSLKPTPEIISAQENGTRFRALMIERDREPNSYRLALIENSGVFGSGACFSCRTGSAVRLFSTADHDGALGGPDDGLRHRAQRQPPEAGLAEGGQHHEVVIRRHEDDYVRGVPVDDLEVDLHPHLGGLLLDVVLSLLGVLQHGPAVVRVAVPVGGGHRPGVGNREGGDLRPEVLRQLQALVDGGLVGIAAVHGNENLSVHACQSVFDIQIQTYGLVRIVVCLKNSSRKGGKSFPRTLSGRGWLLDALGGD